MEEVKFKLTQSQLRKLAHALRNNTDLTLRLNSKDISPTAGKKNGGFIQALLPFLPAILGGVSAITGIAKKSKTWPQTKRETV